MKKLLIPILLCLFAISLFAQSSPKREFRGVWVASVVNLDWPTSPALSVEAQKAQLIRLLDEFEKDNFNAVLFQVRPECDALYESPYEPWSYWLTGEQGKAPSPYYDPLTFAIEEAHKRGMELHAWLNPYRAVRSAGSYPISEKHVTKQHPEWVLQFGSLKILDPGIPDVRDFNTKVVMDIVKRYNVDGIHFDDYFYPYSGTADEDAATFAEYNRGFTDVADWRRDNVNLLMKQIMDSINVVKPHVKFGISPFGIWKSGIPAGTYGLDAYDVLYADPMAWLNDGSIDYLTPQLYWKIGGGQDYKKLLPWWGDSVAANNRHFYPGNIVGTDRSYSENELPAQYEFTRQNENAMGNVIFRGYLVLDNALGFADFLKDDFYKYPAVPPVMNWKDQVNPNAPKNLRYENIAGSRGDVLVWDAPDLASDGDSAFMYGIYKFNQSGVLESDLQDPKNILEVQPMKNLKVMRDQFSEGKMYFVVTAFDRNFNESDIPQVLEVEIVIPEKPLLVLPEDGATDQIDSTLLVWTLTPHSDFNRLQVSDDENFSSIIYDETNLIDTTKIVDGLEGQKTYYWRVSALNAAGESEFSAANSFVTGFPVTPIVVTPAHATTNVLTDADFIWKATDKADKYRIQIFKGLSDAGSNLFIDTVVVADTLLSGVKMDYDSYYSWKVSAGNEYGFGTFSELAKFKTEEAVSVEDKDQIPTEYMLRQNYPNPFNPSTTIEFSIPASGFTSLKIYDILGNEVAILVEEDLSAGRYKFEFNAEGLSSGMYVYKLTSGSAVLSEKMMLLK